MFAYLACETVGFQLISLLQTFRFGSRRISLTIFRRIDFRVQRYRPLFQSISISCGSFRNATFWFRTAEITCQTKKRKNGSDADKYARQIIIGLVLGLAQPAKSPARKKPPFVALDLFAAIAAKPRPVQHFCFLPFWVTVSIIKQIPALVKKIRLPMPNATAFPILASD